MSEDSFAKYAEKFNVTEQQVTELKTAFDLFTGEGNDSLGANELGKVFRMLGQNTTEAELQDMVIEVDADCTGRIDFEEFLCLMCQQLSSVAEEDEIQKAFRMFDQEKEEEELVTYLEDLGGDRSMNEFSLAMSDSAGEHEAITIGNCQECGKRTCNEFLHFRKIRLNNCKSHMTSSLSKSGRLLVIGTCKGDVIAHDLEAKRTVKEWEFHHCMNSHNVNIMRVDICPNDSILAVANYGGTLKFYQAYDQSFCLIAEVDEGRRYGQMVFSLDKRFLAFDCIGTIYFYKISGRYGAPEKLERTCEIKGSNSMTFLPDSRHLAVVSEEGSLKFYPTKDLASGIVKESHVIEGVSEYNLSFDPLQKYFCVKRSLEGYSSCVDVFKFDKEKKTAKKISELKFKSSVDAQFVKRGEGNFDRLLVSEGENILLYDINFSQCKRVGKITTDVYRPQFSKSYMYRSLTLYNFRDFDSKIIEERMDSPEFEIIVKFFGGESTSIPAQSFEKVGEIKERIEEEVGVGCELQRLIFEKTPIKDDTKSLKDYGITKDCEILLINKPGHSMVKKKEKVELKTVMPKKKHRDLTREEVNELLNSVDDDEGAIDFEEFKKMFTNY